MYDNEEFVTSLDEWIAAFQHHSMHEFFHFSRERNFSMSQIGALMHLHRHGCSGVSDIGEDLGVTNAAASQMLDKLVQQGFIIRDENPADRRAKRIVLTESGREAIHHVSGFRKRWFEVLAETMSSEEKRVVVRALNILTEKTKQLENTDYDAS